MLNNIPYNRSVINSTEIVNIPSVIWEVISTSFSSTLKTKYAFKSKLWSYFNFNNFCVNWTKYWNYIKTHNFDDIADTDIKTYWNSLRHGWVIYDKRYEQKTLNMEIIITSDNITNLENEIQDLKSWLELWWECYKKEQNDTLKISTTLVDFQVSRLRLVWTIVKIRLLTMDPFWITENNTWSFNWSLNLSNTWIAWFAKHIIFAKTVTWTINQITFTLSWFPIIINEVITSWTPIILNWITWKVYVNWIRVRFLWQFPELQINESHTLTVDFAWGWSVDDFDLHNIYPNQKL